MEKEEDLLVDRACWERGCACYQPLFGDHDGVEVVQRKEWINLTDQQLIYLFKDYSFDQLTVIDIAREVSEKLKELNHQ